MIVFAEGNAGGQSLQRGANRRRLFQSRPEFRRRRDGLCGQRRGPTVQMQHNTDTDSIHCYIHRLYGNFYRHFCAYCRAEECLFVCLKRKSGQDTDCLLYTSAGKDDKEDYNEIKDTVAALRNKMKKRMKEMSEEFASLPEEETLARIRSTGKPAEYLCSLVKEFHGIFTAKKREKSLVDFNDIEHLALQILDHEEAASDVRKHFRVIFVDEYQDSSILQETLIQKISRGDNVYMVGDVKQSIYKFRLR